MVLSLLFPSLSVFFLLHSCLHATYPNNNTSLQVARVTNYQICTQELLSEIKATLRFLDALESEYKVVSTKTGELHRACEALVQEKVRLELLSLTNQ